MTFRSWLVDRLAGTHWATEPTKDADLEKVARKLGVQVDVLVEARVNAKILAASDGRAPRLGRKVGRTEHYQYHLYLPERIHELLTNESEVRGVEPVTLVRSLIHAYLSGSYEPRVDVIGKYWIWEHKRLYVPTLNQDKRHWRFRVFVLLPNGVKRALVIRSQRRNATMTGIVRGIVTEMLEGRFARHGQLSIIAPRHMWDDEKRYYLGEPVEGKR